MVKKVLAFILFISTEIWHLPYLTHFIYSLWLLIYIRIGKYWKINVENNRIKNKLYIHIYICIDWSLCNIFVKYRAASRQPQNLIALRSTYRLLKLIGLLWKLTTKRSLPFSTVIIRPRYGHSLENHTFYPVIKHSNPLESRYSWINVVSRDT